MTTGNYPPGGTWEIDNGWDVITSDGDKIGDVEEVHPHYLVVGKGFIFHSERYVPVSTISSVENNKVHIGVSKSEVERLGWDTIPDPADTTSMAGGSMSGTTGMTDTNRSTDPTRRTDMTDYDRRDTDDVRAPVREETVRVERHTVTSERADDIDDHAFQEEDIEIPLRGEEVDVSKQQVSGKVRREDVLIEGEEAIERGDRP